MFDKYEKLICSVCGESFTGRRPSEDADVICPKCISANELPIINSDDNIPKTVYTEILTGGGEDD